MILKINKILFCLFLGTLAVSFFIKRDYRSINDLSPLVFNEPVQNELTDKTAFRFARNGFEYEVTPLYSYEINSLVVHRLDYTWFSIYKRSSVFPLDLCVVWGDNVKNKVYQNKALSFSQDSRFCWAVWQRNVGFDMNQLSNNHLVVASDAMEKKIKSLAVGDQVRLIGKLVNIKAENIGEPGKYDPEAFTWNTSVTRTDAGAGACETILVEDIEILKKAHPFFQYLFKISLYAIIALVIFRVIYFFIEAKRFFKEKK